MNRSPYELIKSTDEALWREGLNSLLIDHSEKACEAIISVLSDKAWHKREAAARILNEWGSEISEIIQNRLDESNPDEFYWLLNVLGHIGGEQSFAVIRKYLNHADSEVKSYAIRALTQHKSIENARPLYPLLNDQNWAVRKLVFEQLLSFGPVVLDDLRKIILSPSQNAPHTVIALFVKIGQDEVIQELKKIYGTGNFQMRFAIISALGELGSSDAIDFIITSLSDPSWAIRKSAGEQLLKLGSKVFDKLTAAFGKSDSLIKHKIIEILVEMLKEKSLPLLQRLMSANDHEFKLLAIENMARLKSDEATNELMKCLAEGDRVISDYASDCLAQKPNLNLDLLLTKLETEDENLRFQIIKIIGSIGGLALNPIVRILESGNKQERLFLLGVLQKIAPHEKLIEVLITLLGDPNWPVRNASANCLVNFGEASVPAIVKALNSTSEDVKFWSRKALLMIGPRAVVILKKILEEGNDPGLMPHIVSALLSMNHADAVPAVLKFLETNDDYRIQSVFESIPEITSKDVINTILNLLTHPDEKVVRWLAHLLEKVESSSLRRSVFLGFSHSSEKVRFYVASAVEHWENLTESDIKIVARQLGVEKSRQNLGAIVRILSKFAYPSTIATLEEYLDSCKPDLMLHLMLETAKSSNPPFLEMLDRLLKKRSEVITVEDVDKVGAILSYVYRKNPDGLVQGLNSPSMAYRLCCIIALDSIDDRKIAFSIMETLLPDEEPPVIKRAVKTLARYFFHDDFRLKGAVTDFLLSLGMIIKEPLIEYIEELENEIDRKALVDLIESVGGEVDPNLLRAKGEAKIVLSDSHLDDVLERRRAALEELEKYDEIIKTSHTMDLAIMFTDVKGYTAFSSKASLSEVMSMLKQHDEILKPVFDKYSGEALKKIGDAFLVVFENHNNAVLAAIEIQRQLNAFNTNIPEERRLAIRIAINSGSVIRTEGDVLGDSVNLASRLEGIGEAFEIIISENTLQRINRSIFEIEDYGQHQLKGIDNPVKAYRVKWG
ncbi:MAG: adenylate cyclase [Clostridiales bacterium]|jgi:HEAT repeat protein/class 3 adenylate cyclase|nr:adenylate cyclase [Clostridiales bacterium]MDN5280902.1 adenylate cyclase [Candidatus Ozemobacter sp.]